MVTRARTVRRDKTVRRWGLEAWYVAPDVYTLDYSKVNEDVATSRTFPVVKKTSSLFMPKIKGFWYYETKTVTLV
jgi:hypothetical protein